MSQNNKTLTAKSIKKFFSSGSKIFKSHKMKRAYFDNDLSFLPENLEEIVHRKEQINQLVHVFGDIKDGSKADARCYGPSGTGKTLTIKWFTRIVLEKLKDENFAKNPRARMRFFYVRSPFYDKRIGVYPVGRIVSSKEISK